MRRLRFLLAGRRADGERGAVLVITVVVVSFVAVGLLALTVDLGNLTYHRAQLQNGADAASLALAAACAQHSTSTPCGVTPTLTDLAARNANVTGQSMSIDTSQAVDGTYKTCIGGAAYAGTTTLPACPSTENTSSLSNCQAWPLGIASNSVSYVEVSTQTQINGSHVLPFDFGQLLGAGKGTTPETCSRAAWGAAGSTGPTLPITMGKCDWTAATSAGTKYVTAPPYSTLPGTGGAPPPEVRTPTNYVTGIFAHATSANTCSSQPSGGFSWLQPDTTSGSTCSAIFSTGTMATTSTGSSVPCAGVLAANLGKVVNIPIFDYSTGTGNGAQYHVMGIAAFYLAGFDNVPSASPRKTDSVYTEPSNVCSGQCNGSTTYVWGWFVSSLLPVGSTTISSAPNMGANVVVPAG